MPTVRSTRHGAPGGLPQYRLQGAEHLRGLLPASASAAYRRGAPEEVCSLLWLVRRGAPEEVCSLRRLARHSVQLQQLRCKTPAATTQLQETRLQQASPSNCNNSAARTHLHQHSCKTPAATAQLREARLPLQHTAPIHLYTPSHPAHCLPSIRRYDGSRTESEHRYS
jgi:hypothetical protein